MRGPYTKVQLKNPPARRKAAATAKELERPNAMTEMQLDKLLMTSMGFRPNLSLARPHGKEDTNWAAQKHAACKHRNALWPSHPFAKLSYFQGLTESLRVSDQHALLAALS